MSMPSDLIAAALVSASIGAAGGSAAWAIFTNALPESPEQAIAVYDQPGKADPKFAMDQPRVTVIVRGKRTGGSAAGAKAEAIKAALEGYNGAGELRSVWIETTPFFFGNDDAERPQFSINMRLLTVPTSPGNRVAI